MNALIVFSLVKTQTRFSVIFESSSYSSVFDHQAGANVLRLKRARFSDKIPLVDSKRFFPTRETKRLEEEALNFHPSR
jgi:DNA-binding GntR family transcriptional regulator